MSDDISYDYVWRILQKEKQTNQLLQTSRSFYSDLADYLVRAQITEKQKENMEKLIASLFEKRKQKILLYVAYKKPLPQPVADSEQEFYNNLVATFDSSRLLTSIPPNKSNKLLRSLIDIPEIILPSGKKFGPHRKDEIIDLTNSEPDREYLIKNSICESYNR
jgi:hypothetical protein